MTIDSRPLGGVTLTNDDAKRFREQVAEGERAADTITALRAEVDALRETSPTMLTAFLTTVSSNGKYIWYEFARAAPKGGDHG